MQKETTVSSLCFYISMLPDLNDAQVFFWLLLCFPLVLFPSSSSECFFHYFLPPSPSYTGGRCLITTVSCASLFPSLRRVWCFSTDWVLNSSVSNGDAWSWYYLVFLCSFAWSHLQGFKTGNPPVQEQDFSDFVLHNTHNNSLQLFII